jgi:FMN phosphatase YigB (HAD superfamily)
MIYSIILDWKRTLYNPDDTSLITGTIQLLELAKKLKIPLFLIGKGKERMCQEVQRLGINSYFEKVIFVEGSKKLEDFEPCINQKNPATTIVIGDRIRSELLIGKSLGCTTIWLKQGKFATQEPENEMQKPDYTFNDLLEVVDFIINKISKILLIIKLLLN